jgi:hypothetical protein
MPWIDANADPELLEIPEKTIRLVFKSKTLPVFSDEDLPVNCIRVSDLKQVGRISAAGFIHPPCLQVRTHQRP